MIFVKTAREDALILMLCEADIAGLRQGQTRVVDPRQLGKETFKTVVLSLHKTDDEAMALVRKMKDGVKMTSPENLKVAAPKANEEVCQGCQGLIAFHSLFEGKCITCWAAEAKKLRVQSN